MFIFPPCLANKLFPSSFPNTTLSAFVLFYALYNSRFCHFPLFAYFSIVCRKVIITLKNTCIYSYINTALASKESSKTRSYQAAVFHSHKVDVPVEKFRQRLLMSNVIFLPSAQQSLHFTSLHFTSLHFTSLHFTSARLHICLPLSRDSFDGSEFQHADKQTNKQTPSSLPIQQFSSSLQQTSLHHLSHSPSRST